MADSESGSPVSYSSFLVTIRLSRLVSEIFACDRETERQRGLLLYSWPSHCGGPANNGERRTECVRESGTRAYTVFLRSPGVST